MNSLRASVLGFEHDGNMIRSQIITQCTDLTQLQEAFNPPKEDSKIFSRRLFVIESAFPRYLSPRPCSNTYSIGAILRAKLGIPEDFCRTHAWERTTFDFNEMINCPRLPTATQSGDRFSLEFFELWDVNGFTESVRDDKQNEGAKLQSGQGITTMKCSATQRQSQLYKWKRRNGWLLIAPRKCSFWSRRRQDGWDAVILCDPPPHHSYIGNRQFKLRARSFSGGYYGFIPDDVLASAMQRSNADTSEAINTTDDGSSAHTETLHNVATAETTTSPHFENPPHSSMFDDLMYYYENHSVHLKNLGSPLSTALFPKKLVASHYCQLLGFVSHQTASMRSSGWAVQRRTQEEIDASNQVEAAWSNFKCPEYLEALSAILDSLGISPAEDPYSPPGASSVGPHNVSQRPLGLDNFFDQNGGSIDWTSSVPDFLFLHREFRLRIADYARMTSSLAALNGIIAGRLGVLEARTATSLTLVAMLFAPPACVASIFSINFQEIFGENGPPFWGYWAAAVPVTVLVFLLTYLVHERDSMKRRWHRNFGSMRS